MTPSEDNPPPPCPFAAQEAPQEPPRNVRHLARRVPWPQGYPKMPPAASRHTRLARSWLGPRRLASEPGQSGQLPTKAPGSMATRQEAQAVSGVRLGRPIRRRTRPVSVS